MNRPLVCAVLKPLGRSPKELAKLAAQFVRGGADLIRTIKLYSINPSVHSS